MANDGVRAAVTRLFAELARIEKHHEELGDTAVREALAVALDHYFVFGRPRSRLPVSFGMFSAEGDPLVAAALAAFLAAVDRDAAAIPVGQARLDCLQDPSIDVAGRHYDEFIGHADAPLDIDTLPAHLFVSAHDD